MFHSLKIKIISFSLALLLILTLVSGCGMTTSATAVSDEEITVGMEYLGYSKGDHGKFYYYREALTDVAYVLYREKSGYAGMGGLTVMLDPETGLPLTNARWQEFYNQKVNTEETP